VYKTARFMYIPYRDTIRTQILNSSQSNAFAKLWNWPKNRGSSAVQLLDVVKPITMVPGRSQPTPGAEPRI